MFRQVRVEHVPAIVEGVDEALRAAFSSLPAFCQVEEAAQIFRRQFLQENYIRIVKQVVDSNVSVLTSKFRPVVTFFSGATRGGMPYAGGSVGGCAAFLASSRRACASY